jgi:outer membrane protein assembly factor BamE (lipoprotein component of BamABCDE complex)
MKPTARRPWNLYPKVAVALALAATLGACATQAPTTSMGNDRFADIHAGLTQDEVRSVAGTPNATIGGSMSGESTWIYNFVDSWGMRAMEDVTFDASGHVARTSSMRMGF